MTELQASPEPASVADLHLPPTFVADHALRTLSYQGPMTAADMAARWRISDAVTLEIVTSLKATGLIETDAGQSTYVERAGRLRLTSAGYERVAMARSRTWYAGPLPVALDDFERYMTGSPPHIAEPVQFTARLGGLAIDGESAREVGQAIAAGSTVALTGLAPDEQPAVAAEIAEAVSSSVLLPHALYAAGSIVRIYDQRFHQTREQRIQPDGDDILRHRDAATRWLPISRAFVLLSGGVHERDVLPAFDQEARFYVAPAPFAACGGLLCVLDADADPTGLAELARLWLLPARYRTGVVLLRTGERIEVPWHAATVLMSAGAPALDERLAGAAAYRVDVTPIAADALARFLRMRLPAVASADVATPLAERLSDAGPVTRTAAARAAQYLRDRAGYEGASFEPADRILEAALTFAREGEGPPRLRAVS